MTKPSWNTAPEWAKHLTFDTSMRWLWSEKKPEQKKYGLAFDFDSMGQYAYAAPEPDVWYTEERPEIKLEVGSWFMKLLKLLAR